MEYQDHSHGLGRNLVEDQCKGDNGVVFSAVSLLEMTSAAYRCDYRIQEVYNQPDRARKVLWSWGALLGRNADDDSGDIVEMCPILGHVFTAEPPQPVSQDSSRRMRGADTKFILGADNPEVAFEISRQMQELHRPLEMLGLFVMLRIDADNDDLRVRNSMYFLALDKWRLLQSAPSKSGVPSGKPLALVIAATVLQREIRSIFALRPHSNIEDDAYFAVPYTAMALGNEKASTYTIIHNLRLNGYVKSNETSVTSPSVRKHTTEQTDDQLADVGDTFPKKDVNGISHSSHESDIERSKKIADLCALQTQLNMISATGQWRRTKDSV